MPDVFKCKSHLLDPGKTVYVVPTSKSSADGQRDPRTETIFSEFGSLPFEQITDGTATTIMLLEVNPEAAVVWTQPDDWEFDPSNPTRDLGNARPSVFLAALADGSVRAIDKNVDLEMLGSMFTARAGD